MIKYNQLTQGLPDVPTGKGLSLDELMGALETSGGESSLPESYLVPKSLVPTLIEKGIATVNEDGDLILNEV